MAFVIADRVRETTTTIGTGSVTLGGAYTSFQTFSAAIGNGNNTYYTIASASSGEWEVGIGTYASGGNLLSRDTVLASSNAGNLVNFSVGSKDVFVTQPSERSLLLNSGSTGLFAGNAAFTANGVLYANSTTTLTTGSALTFNGTNFGVGGTALEKFAVVGTTSSLNINPDSSGTAVMYAYMNSAYNPLRLDGLNQQFYISGTEQMRLTSTGLGIGTSSPYTKFDVTSGSLAAPTLGSPTAYAAAFRNGVGGGGYGLGVSVQSSGNAWLQAQRFDGTATAYDMVLQPLGGNVGIGTSSPSYKLDVAGSTSTARLGKLTITNDAPFVTGANLDAGAQSFALGTSGAGIVAFFSNNTERMRLDTSGNLGIGTSSPATKLDVQISSGRFQIYPAVTATGVRLLSVNTGNSAAVPMEISGTDIRFTNSSNTLVGIFDSSGNLGIGTSSPGAKLDVNGGTNSEMRLTTSGSGYLQVGQFTNGAFIGTSSSDATAGQLRLGTGGASQVWLSTTGNLGIGTSSPDAKLDVTSAGSAAAYTVSAVIQDGTYPASGNPTLEFNGFIGGNGYRSGIGSIGGQQLAFYTPSTFGVAPTRHMTLTEVGNFGIGTNSPSNKLVVSNAGAAGLEFAPGETNGPTIYSYNRSTSAWTALQTFASQQIFCTNGTTEGMRLDSSGNLGIGTTSPATKLHVNTGAAGYGITVAATSQTSITYQLGIDSNSNLAFYDTNAAAQRLVLSTSGNLGLGVTPSASWDVTNSARALQFTGGALFSYSTTQMNYLQNAYYNGSNFIYLNTAAASAYRQISGAHSWYTAASGTAGNAITFTQAMTLDASGNLVLGATSANARLDVVGGSIRVNEDTIGTKIITVRSDYAGLGPAINVTTSHPLLFLTANTERARITSGGYFKASNGGTYINSTGNYHEFRTNAADYIGYFSNTNASSPFGVEITYTGTDPNGTGNRYFGCYASATQRLEVRSNGGLANYQANDVNLSDRREKTNFAPAKSYLDTICAIPVQTFNYIDQSEDDPGLTLGVVAQDVQTVAPELVMESNWGTEDNPKMRLSIYQTDLQYALMKCIQELKAEVDSLKAQLKGA